MVNLTFAKFCWEEKIVIIFINYRFKCLWWIWYEQYLGINNQIFKINQSNPANASWNDVQHRLRTKYPFNRYFYYLSSYWRRSLTFWFHWTKWRIAWEILKKALACSLIKQALTRQNLRKKLTKNDRELLKTTKRNRFAWCCIVDNRCTAKKLSKTADFILHEWPNQKIINNEYIFSTRLDAPSKVPLKKN